MPGRSWLVLAAVLAVFAYGVFSLLVVRFESGDVYPEGSTLRTDPLGAKAAADALAELQGLRVEQHRGTPRALEERTDAALFFFEVRVADLLAPRAPLPEHVDEAVRGGARAVVLLSDEDAARCVQSYCRYVDRPTCRPPDEDPSPFSSAPPREECDDAETAAGKWGFSVRGTPGWRSRASESAELTPSLGGTGLPLAIPWQLPAYFDDLDPAFSVVYRAAGNAVVIERRLGEGSVVLVGGSYLLENEGLREHRSAALLAWLVGDRAAVVFDEAHLGVEERRGIVSLARRHGLGGFFVGVLVLGALFVWRARTSWAPPAAAPPGADPGATTEDGVGRLLRRVVPERRLLEVCLAEAASVPARERGAAPIGVPALATKEKAGSSRIVESYNRIVHETHERKVRP